MANHCEVCRYNNICEIAYMTGYCEDCNGKCLNLNSKPDFEDRNDYTNDYDDEDF